MRTMQEYTMNKSCYASVKVKVKKKDTSAIYLCLY